MALTVPVSLLASAVATLPLPRGPVGVGSGTLQQVLHLGFTALAGANAPLFPSMGHVHNQAVPPPGGAAAASAPEDLHLMVVAHVAAALATGLLVAWALRAAERPKAAVSESEIVPSGAGKPPLRVVEHHLVHIR